MKVAIGDQYRQCFSIAQHCPGFSARGESAKPQPPYCCRKLKIDALLDPLAQGAPHAEDF